MEQKSKDKVVVVFSANDKYSPYLATVMQSVIAHTDKNREYELIALHTSISAKNRALIGSLSAELPHVDIRFIDLSEEMNNKSFFVGGKKDLTVETYFRLFIPKILGEEYKKVVYLDCDMIVLADIAELFDTDIHDKLFASAADYCAIGKYYMQDREQVDYWHNKLRLKNIEEYFCAGMLVMNLEKLRDIGTGKIVALAAGYEWKKHDQDVLNYLGNGKTLMLHPAWDVLKAFDEVQYLPKHIMDKVKEAEKNPKIVHYSSSYKPWNTGFIDRFEYFWQYASQTPYFYEMVRKLNDERPYQCYIIKNFTASKKIDYTFKEDDVLLSYKDGDVKISLGSLRKNYTKLENICISGNTLSLRGKTMLMTLENCKQIRVFLIVGREKIPCKILPGDYSEKKSGIRTYFGVGFSCEVPLENIREKTKIQLCCEAEGHLIAKKALSFGNFAPLSNAFSCSYYFKNGYAVTKEEGALYVAPCSAKERKKLEKKFRKEIVSRKKLVGLKAVFIRKLYFLAKKYSKKQIWLFSDRANKADDNGEAMFRYVCEKSPRGVKPVFIIDKKSSDYKRMKKIGRVADSMSWKHKWLFLNCTCNISSQADVNDIYVFLSGTDLYRDLVSDIKFVFLQHGVIKEDMSQTYNRTNQNMSVFVTAAYPEYRSILENPAYECDESIAKLTGLPRHDRLYHDEKNVITLMPTWRRYLFKHSTACLGVWEPRENFQNSEYFHFYDELINSPRLLEALQKYGYELRFMPHPNVHGAVKYFHKNDKVQFYPLTTPYSKIFAESKLVITDRSSAIMDFVYLRKPVLYCLFDDDDFMAGQHVYTKGYFDYERDGFGKVSYDLESIIDNIIAAMQNDCRIEDVYRERIDKFFAFNDKENCKRVYEEIVKKISF